jgi:hypothetical protein
METTSKYNAKQYTLETNTLAKNRGTYDDPEIYIKNTFKTSEHQSEPVAVHS